jgi:hypothetical protein
MDSQMVVSKVVQWDLTMDSLWVESLVVLMAEMLAAVSVGPSVGLKEYLRAA